MDEKQTPACQGFRTSSLFVDTTLGSRHRKFPKRVRRSTGLQAGGYTAWPSARPTLAEHGLCLPQSTQPCIACAVLFLTLPLEVPPWEALLPQWVQQHPPPTSSPSRLERIGTQLEILHPFLKVAAQAPKSMSGGIRQVNFDPVRKSLRLDLLI